MDFITRAISGESSSENINSSQRKKKCPPSPPPPSYSSAGGSDGYNPEAKAYYPKNSPTVSPSKKAANANNTPPNYNNSPPPPFYCNPSAFLGGYLNCGTTRPTSHHHGGRMNLMMNAPSPTQPMGGSRSSSSLSCTSAVTSDGKSTPAPAAHNQMFDYILVCDFEATCQENNFCFPNEIIEFPVVAIHLESNKIIGQFHSFVKPKKFNGQLTPFCTELTGITQEQVDEAPGLEVVVNKFNRWMVSTIPADSRVIFATDGPTDMENFMYKHSVLRDGIEFPRVFYKYVDVRRSFVSLFGTRPGGPKVMLSHLGLEFEGRQHSGLDDTKNIARIVMAMNSHGYFLKQNRLCFEAFSVCELHHRRTLIGPASYPADLIQKCRAANGPHNTTTPVEAISNECETIDEQQEPSPSSNEPEFPDVADQDKVGDDDDVEPFILPNAAVDIVSPSAKRSSVPNSPEPKKKFATHMRNKAKQQGVANCVNNGSNNKKLSVRNVSKLPIAETLEQGLPAVGVSLTQEPQEQLTKKKVLVEQEVVQVATTEEDHSSAGTQSPGLTSNSSFALSSAAPSSAQASGASSGGVRHRRRVHKKKTIRVTPV